MKTWRKVGWSAIDSDGRWKTPAWSSCAFRTSRASVLCTTFVRSRLSMQFVRNTPSCLRTASLFSVKKYLRHTTRHDTTAHARHDTHESKF